jgi:hypothetical protein
MIFGLLVTALGLGAACALLYYCAIFALPVFIGLSVAFWVMNAGAGVVSVLVGLAAGVVVFVIGQFAFSRSHSLAVRWMIALLFALPAAVAGYSLVLQLSELGVPSIAWRHALAVIGAAIIGFTTIAQLGKLSAKRAGGFRSSYGR